MYVTLPPRLELLLPSVTNFLLRVPSVAAFSTATLHGRCSSLDTETPCRHLGREATVAFAREFSRAAKQLGRLYDRRSSQYHIM